MTLAKMIWALVALGFSAAAQEAPAPAPPAEYTKDSEATQPRPAPGGEATLWMNPLEWTWVNSGREDTDIYFLQSGRAQARLIVLQEGATPAELLERTVEKLRKVDTGAHVGFEEERIVNGEAMLCAQIMVGESTDKEVVYYGYLFGDEKRSVQLFTIAQRADLPELYIDLTSLLNGLEIAKEAK